MSAELLPGRRAITLQDLEKSLRRPRSLFSFVLSLLVTILTILAAVPLFSVIYMLLVRGGQRLLPIQNVSGSMSFSLQPLIDTLTDLQPVMGMVGGGVGNAIVGTLVIVAMASLFSIPFGILGGVYLAEISPDSKLATTVRFCAKVLTGFPSVLAGVFAYGAVVYTMKTTSALAGAVALAVLMLPIIMLTAEQAIRMVPARMREAAIGMGCTQWQVVRKVLLPTALPMILTGVMLAVARAAGETAPLLLTAGFPRWWPTDITDQTPSLAVLIFKFATSYDENQKALAWTAALILVVLVLGTNLIGQSLTKRQIHR
jgi:phosphate transport system permease protein